MSVQQLQDEITVTEGQVYKDVRNETLFQVLYVDGNVYLVQNDDGSHRFGKRDMFDDNINAGRYELQEDVDTFADTGDGSTAEMAFAELANIGEKGAENLRKNGIKTRADVMRASDEEILDISWIGDGGLESLREEVA